MGLQQIETDNFILRLHDNLLKELIVKKNKTLSVADIKESLRLTEETMPGKKLYVLIEGEENASVSTEAMNEAASEAYTGYSAALALCSPDSYLSVSGELYLKVKKPVVPTRFFSNRAQALEWLKGLMPEGV